MKKYLRIIASALVCSVLFSCSKADLADAPHDVDVETDEAATFYDNLNLIVESAYVGRTISTAAEENPIFSKLNSIRILDENDASISFFDMDAEEQKAFFSEYSKMNTESLREKIRTSVLCEEYIKGQNRIVKKTISSHSLATKADGKVKISDIDAFLTDLQANMESFQMDPVELPATKSVKIPDTVRIKNTVASVAKKGDMILCLPVHESPLILLNPFNSESLAGHVEIFTEDIKPTVQMHDLVTVGAQLAGVYKWNLDKEWRTQFYILGIKVYDYKWEKLKLKKIERKINTSLLSDKAETYIGCEYVKPEEFLISKLAAPKRFSCATLCWWCARELYDIELAPWLTPVITPSDIYLNEHTYIKASVD